MLISVIVVGNCLGNIAEASEKAAAETRKDEMLNKPLDEQFIRELQETGGDDGVDAGEFLAHFLIKLGIVSEDDCAKWMAEFQDMDADGSGYLDQDDVAMWIANQKAEEESTQDQDD